MSYSRIPPLDDLMHDMDEMERLMDLDQLSLAQGLMDATEAGIYLMSMAEEDPSGAAWPSLHPLYLDWKQHQGLLMSIGRLHGLMLSHEELRGERTIDKHKAEMQYGITQQAREEATQFTEGGAVTGTQQPPRPFYDLGPESIMRTDDAADISFNANFDHYFP